MINWLQITSGRGPEECCWVVAKLSECIIKEAEINGISCKIIETIPDGRSKRLKSALISLEGDAVVSFAKSFEGTVQWIGKSMFRPHHKRKNWYVGVNLFSPPEENKWSFSQLKVEKMRSSGPGGQNVNKRETATRITHIPTGLSVTAQEERSQHLNKKLALSRLDELLKQKESETEMKNQNSRWNGHNRLERGNPVRVYKNENFSLTRS
ncbi:MAG: peptide chain release factor H [Desulfobacterales bacterium]|nr:peptide chain release factor H [Desulfobacterales bacterium]